MSITKKVLVAFLILLVVGGGVARLHLWRMGKAGTWESSIRQFEKADRLHPPPPGVIVFAGSSSIRLWDTLVEDMKPLEVLNRGFGGSQIAEVNHYVSRIVIPYHPRAVVLYAGENDLYEPWSKSPEAVFADFRKFVQIVHSQLPETWIYYVSMKPSPSRLSHWAKFQEANRLIEDYAHTQSRVEFIDIRPVMLDAQGRPRPELFRADGLHMNAAGYALWTSMIKPVLLERFGTASR